MSSSFDGTTGTYISSFGVQRDIFHAFFGYMEDGTSIPTLNNMSESDDSFSDEHSVDSPFAAGATISPASPNFRDPSPLNRISSESGSPLKLEIQMHNKMTLDSSITPYNLKGSNSSSQVLQSLLLDENGRLPFIYYDVHTRNIYTMNEREADIEDLTFAAFRNTEHTVYIIEEEGLSVAVHLRRLRQHPLRIVVKKGYKSISQERTSEVQRLVQIYNPGLDTEKVMKTWPYNTS